MYVTYTEEHFCGTVYFTDLTNISLSSFHLNSKCDVTLSLLHQNVRLQAAVYNKNSYHCTLTKIIWREKQNLWRSCKKLTILLNELPVSLHTKQFQVLARQLTNHEEVKSNIPER